MTILQNIMRKKLQLLGDFVPRPLPGLCPWTPRGDFHPEPPDWSVFILGLSGGILPPQKKKNQKSPKNSTRPKNWRHEFMAG